MPAGQSDTEPLFDLEGTFDADYLYFYGPDLTPERTAREAEAIWDLLALGPGQAVLDLGCGHGRIANALAERGARVSGLDRTPLFLERAQADAAAMAVDVDYVQGDMRRLPWAERFDAIVIWFTSFGYFGDDDNEEVLRQSAQALKPGGRLLIDQINPSAMLRLGPPTRHVVQRGDDLMIDLTDYDVVTDRIKTERIIVRNGRVRRATYSVRLYGVPELARMLRSAGFQTVDAFGRNGEAITAEGWRLVVRAQL